MKTLTVRLPERLAVAIKAESRRRGISEADVVCECLRRSARASREAAAPPETIADLIGSVNGLPSDLSTRKKRHPRSTGHGRKRSR